jgi:hypothetical protein
MAATFITKSVAGIQIFFSDSSFFSLKLLPNFITTEDPRLLEHDFMFLSEQFPTFRNDRSAVMFRDKQCYIPEGLGRQQLDCEYFSLTSRPLLRCFLSLFLYGGRYLWWLLGLFTLPEAWGPTRYSLCGIYGRQSGTGMDCSLSISVPSLGLPLHQYTTEPSIGPGNGQCVCEGRQLNSDTARSNRWS